MSAAVIVTFNKGMSQSKILKSINSQISLVLESSKCYATTFRYLYKGVKQEVGETGEFRGDYPHPFHSQIIF